MCAKLRTLPCIQNGMNSLFGEEGDGMMFDGFLN